MGRKRPVCFQRVTRPSRRQCRKGALAATDSFRIFGAAYEIEMSATPGLSRECRFGKRGKLCLPFVTMTPEDLSFALSI